MFEILTQKLAQIWRQLSNKGKLSETDIDEALRQVRLALLEADVNFKVVKEFLSQVRPRLVATEILGSLTPMQQIIKVVNEELVIILGKEPSHLQIASQPPSIAMLVGLQGSGKTTTAAKLALHLKQTGHSPLLIAADVRRPAAIEQIVTLGKELNIPVHTDNIKTPPITICTHGIKQAKEIGAAWIIIDTQGRLHIDETMMKELAQMKARLRPSEVLLTVDAMTGQDAIKIAQEFQTQVGLTGLILTKMDGDAQGGAALSIRFITGVPIKFIGVGEKPYALEPFYPERVASRILGMGDILTLIEKAERAFDASQVKELEKKIRSTRFSLEDFLWQLRQIKKMGPVTQIVEMLPGASNLAPQLSAKISEKQLKKVEAIILSMTREERHNPFIINGSRRRRIARGSGTTPQDINQLLNQFQQIQKLTKMATKGKLPKNFPFIS